MEDYIFEFDFLAYVDPPQGTPGPLGLSESSRRFEKVSQAKTRPPAMPRTDGKPIAKTAAKTGQDPLVEQLVDSGTPREKAERMSAEMQRNGRYRVVSAKERARAVSAKERGDEKIAEGKLQEEPVQTVDLLSEEEAVNDVAPEAVASAKSVEVAGSRTPPQKAKPTPRAAGTPKPRTPPQKAKPTRPPAKPRTPPQKAKPTPRAAGTAGPLPGRPKRMMFTAAEVAEGHGDDPDDRRRRMILKRMEEEEAEADDPEEDGEAEVARLQRELNEAKAEIKAQREEAQKQKEVAEKREAMKKLVKQAQAQMQAGKVQAAKRQTPPPGAIATIPKRPKASMATPTMPNMTMDMSAMAMMGMGAMAMMGMGAMANSAQTMFGPSSSSPPPASSFPSSSSSRPPMLRPRLELRLAQQARDADEWEHL